MRLSVREDDPGYDSRAVGHCSVFVDGVDVTSRCHTADEEEGKAWCLKWNELNMAFFDSNTGERAEEVLTGKVIILLNDKMNGDDSHTCH